MLHEEVLAVEQVGFRHHLVERGELLLVEADAAALRELAHLALAGEALGVLCKEVNGLRAFALEQVAAYLELRHTAEDVEKRLLVELHEAFLRALAEEDAAGFYCCLVVLLAVNHDGQLLGQLLLQDAQARVFAMLLDEGVDGRLVERGEYLDVAFCVLVGHVEPELVEGVGRGAVAVEPDVAFLRLAELLAVGLSDERAGEGKGFVVATELATDELCAGGDVAPLVAAAHLQFAVLGLVEVEEVVALQQLIGELGERHAVLELTVEAALDAVLRHHVIDGDALADFASEVEEGEVLHPVVVVDQLSAVGCVAFEVEEVCQLLLDALHVVAQGFLVQQVALLAFSAGVAYHAGCSADECDGFVAAALQVTQHHHTAEVADVQAVGRRVDADVGRYLFFK